MASIRAARDGMDARASESRSSEDSMDSQNTWPMAGGNNAFLQSQTKGIAPQRPPRPSYVPSMLGEQENPEYGQSQQYSRTGMAQQNRYWEPNHPMAAPLTPGTPSSRDSAGSSVGSIPDFPVPAIPANIPQPIPRRPQNMGPPPTQRKGPSSYYSTGSHVAPIPEESIEMPQSLHPTQRALVTSEDWYDDAPSIYIDRSSLTSAPGEHLVEPAGLVRNASMGKQYKPSMTTVRPANEITRQQKGHAAPLLTVVDRSHLAAEHTVFVESVDSDDEDDSSFRGRDSMEGTTFLREKSADSDIRRDGLLGEKEILVSPPDSREHSPIRQDPRVEHLMAGLKKGGAIPTGTTAPVVAAEGRLKPAPFDFATERSSRASMTSLSDLIRRATKVKTNLDRGRTASRLGLLDFFTTSKSDLLKPSKDERPRESLTDMLESFPPPADNTPTNDEPTRWPTPFVNNNKSLPYAKKEPERSESRGRKCCGIPFWGFILLMVLLFVLIAAAVLIPVFLIVIPNQQKANAACPNAFPCSNGGYSLTSSDGCRCICTSGYTGSQCTQSAPVTSDCTTADLESFSQVTVGTKVLPLLEGASNYSIPLNSTLILSDFSTNKLYCGDENNLVTFLNTGSQRKRSLEQPAPTAVAILAPRDVLGRDAQADATMTSLALDGSIPTATSSGAVATATSPSTAQLGFAETAILYILQQNSLDNARLTRNSLDKAFQNGNWFGPVVITSNITVDLRLSKVTLGTTTVGAGS